MEWLLRQNCAMTPGQVGVLYVFISAISLCIGVFFWMLGATLVLPFSALEVVVLGLGFLCFARRAIDREHICLHGTRVTVVCELGGIVYKADFERDWLRIEWSAQQQLIELRGRGQVILVGRFVRPEWRAALAAEIRRAVRVGC